MADDAALIVAIYDAVIDPSRWDEVVQRIVEATKSFSGNLVLQQPGAGSLTALYNVDPVIAEVYAPVFVVDPAAGLGAKLERFAANFGLTLAETRVLGEIIGGKGLLAAATKLKITELTARSHANRIFAKTGTARQTELIRRFFETALLGVAGA